MKNNLISIDQSSLHPTFEIFLVSGPMIETMMQWKALSIFGDSTFSSTICCCLNFHQGSMRNESPRPKLISPKDIAGEIEIYY